MFCQAPWVHPNHSNATLLSIAEMLPSGLIGNFDKIANFVGRNIAPACNASASAFTAVASVFKKDEPSEKELDEKQKKEEGFGMNKEEVELMEKLGVSYMMAEGVSGVTEEALLCLKKTAKGTEGVHAHWGCAENYEVFVRGLAERERRRTASGSDGHEEPCRLRVDAFFGQSDFVIGKGGQRYFRNCWTNPEYADVIDVEEHVIDRSNHDSVMDVWRSGFLKLLEETKKSLG